jgi:signal transduction histidine kinase
MRSGRAAGVPLGAELVLAFAAGAASFTVLAVALASAEADVLDALVAAAGLAAVVAMERFLGIAYAVPAAIAGLVAYDWFVLPPTHRHAFPDSANLADLLAYLVVGALVGELAAHAARRAELSELARSELADEHAALRRVATLVARGVAPQEVFAAAAEELARLLGVPDTRVYQYDGEGSVTVVARYGEPDLTLPVGTHVECPIVVDGRVWGAIVAASPAELLPAGTEARIAPFSELVATAISNILARSAVAASRARIVAATDQERRRVVRDLHDGAQQRLVHTIITLKLARAALDDHGAGAPALVTEALHAAEGAMVELRELSHGILPSVLTWGGLRAGVAALASRMPFPVEVSVPVDRLGTEVEATAYFVVAEALTNVAKHAYARHASVTADIAGGTLRVEVRDNGVGGARQDGTGLQGLADRVAVLDGRLRVDSPPGAGTVIAATLPIAA